MSDYLIKNVGITFQYIKNSERCICTRVGKTYSFNENIYIGIPQDSGIALSLFIIPIHDLPKAPKTTTTNKQLAHYADDIAVRVNTILRKHTNKRVLNLVQNLCQSGLNKSIVCMCYLPNILPPFKLSKLN